MNFKISTINLLMKQVVTIEDEENPRNYIVLNTYNATDEIQNLIKQLEQYLKERK